MIAELPTFKAQVLKVKNRAVFEVVESLERILNSAAL
jgi:hypothetical protein